MIEPVNIHPLMDDFGDGEEVGTNFGTGHGGGDNYAYDCGDGSGVGPSGAALRNGWGAGYLCGQSVDGGHRG